MFASGESIPPEFSRPEVVAVLREYYDDPDR
jgi:ATP sulfurylase